jgi:hypothetical protein
MVRSIQIHKFAREETRSIESLGIENTIAMSLRRETFTHAKCEQTAKNQVLLKVCET